MSDDDEYEVPLLDQRYFGSGLKRKRIHFVPSTANQLNESVKDKNTASDKYLAIVLGKGPNITKAEGNTSNREDPGKADETKIDQSFCEICQKPLNEGNTETNHASSITHQICLQHSHPPSNIDRRRKGLAVLQDQGWNPDSRLGLGRVGEGRLYPVKAEERLPRAGLGAQFVEIKPEPKLMKLDAGKVREQESKRSAERDRLRDSFYRSEELDKYLGEDTDVYVQRRALSKK